MSSHIPGQWPAELRESATRKLAAQERRQAAEQAWQDETLARARATFAAEATPEQIRDAAARIAARVVRLAEAAIQQHADAHSG